MIFLMKLWNNNVLTIITSAIIFLFSCITLFPDFKAGFITFLVVAQCVAFLVLFIGKKWKVGQSLLFATIIALIFATTLGLLSLIGGGPKCRYCGGKGYFGGGKYGQMVDCPDC